MRPFIHVTPLALLFNLLLAEPLYFTASPPTLEASQESMAAISTGIPPIKGGCKHKGDFQCLGTSEGGETKSSGLDAPRCVGEDLYRHCTEKPEMKPTATACADIGFPITVEKVPPLKKDNLTAKIQPTTYLQHPGSIGSTASDPPALNVPPKPVQSHLPAHDPATTSSSTPLNGPLTATLALVSTVTVFFALAA